MLQKFCIADPFSTKNQQWTSNQKTLSPDYNLLFNIIKKLSGNIPLSPPGVEVPNKEFFVLIDEFLDADNMPHWLLFFDSLLLQGSSFVLIYPALNLRIHRFTFDFVKTFCASYTTHSRLNFTT